jgi:hypothetical protein
MGAYLFYMQVAVVRIHFGVLNSLVAQLVRAFGRHPKGHRFESGQDYKSQCRITAITHRWYR